MFDVTPQSEAKVTVDLSLGFANVRLKKDLYQHFKTKVRMNMKLVYSWPDGMKIRKSYAGNGEKESCVRWTAIPTTKTVEEALQMAMDDMFANLTKARVE